MKKGAILLIIFLTITFTSLVSPMNINVTSPINNGIYASNPVNVDASSDEAVNWTLRVDGNQWHEATNTSTFSYSISPTKDVSHILIISASNSSTSINNTISFYVDTLPPNITSQTPANNSNASRGNISFSVSYTEANLNYTKIYWKNLSDSVYREENVFGCGSGTSISCSKNIDFSSFSYGANISYFFSLTDAVLRNTNYSEYKFTLVCSPSWSCTGWGSCSGSTQTRTCTDSNSCGTSDGKPSESQSCSDSQNTQTTNTQTNATVQNVYYFLTESQLKNSSLRTLKKAGDKITFKIKNESHSLELIKMFSNKISIKISSNEKYTNLTLNEVNKFDLTADKYYDISVTLKRLTSSEADILLNVINEKVPETIVTPVTTNTTAGNVSIEMNNTTSEAVLNETEKESKFSSKITGALLGAFKNIKKVPIYFIVASVIFILGLVATTFMLIRKRKKRWGYR